ncbi:hypothetical protein SEA_PUREGLOBE5_106 [Arthrobacter phage Pureglobe5]|nr:hypothetical protein SEA_PUREGLOBE5_106 [Arthrobacter phage Pureglobe5]
MSGDRVELSALFPDKPGEGAGRWTDRILSHAREHGTNRQCSIGWHEECSDPAGETCMCLCHDEAVQWWSVEGHREGGLTTITRVEEGKHRWPPVKGEPATMWAHWILARNRGDAVERATAKQIAIESD